MAARREAARRRRQLQARIAGGVAGVVLLGAVIWIVVAVSSNEPEQTPAPVASDGWPCSYPEAFPQPSAEPTASGEPTDPAATGDPADPSASPESNEPTPTPSPLPEGIQDVGFPVSEPPRSGFQVFTFETNLGTIQVEADLSKTPCTANSIAYLASKGFYDNTSCHRLVPDIYALQCGDPSGTGRGGPNYRFADENLPAGLPAYHEGDVAMANAGPDTNGSQFFFVYGVGPLRGNYTLWGKVISGFDVIQQVAAGGVVEGSEMEDGGPHPTVQLTFTKVTAGPVTPTSSYTPTPTPSATPSASPEQSATPSPSAS
ncbi:MAG: peptidylprolyl isomerase [Micromonosporaceae bacterium]|nr:peptidylprolyl isomerase [Micromonosporaceae bacterium]